VCITHRIHGAGIYANIWGILMVNVTIAYMDPMGYDPASIDLTENVDCPQYVVGSNSLAL
jgi:hypothetical protein